MSETETFEIGEKVLLKSNETVMVIKDIPKDGFYTCYWNDPSGKYHESDFNHKLLTKYDDSDPILTIDNLTII